MTFRTIASRKFELADQLRFAAISGDANPMHVDPLAARRTQFGEVVVHGVHGLLWALDAAAAGGVDLSIYRGLTAQFSKPVLLGDDVSVHVELAEAAARIELRVGDLPCSIIRLTREPPRAAPDWPLATTPATARRASARELGIEQIQGLEAVLDYSAADLVREFPAAARALGASVLEGLAAATYIVGMEAPGLHSIFTKLTATVLPQAEASPVAFRVANADTRFRIVDILLRTPALSARLNTFARVPPVPPPGMNDVRSLVRAGEFSGQRALVVGGSRGLGAATAQIVAAGGGDVTITYARGRAEAAQVASAISSLGLSCEATQFDASAPASGQLDLERLRPNAVYYFATGPIWRRKVRKFEPAILADFMKLHVDGFATLVEDVRRATTGPLVLFYPSSVYAAEAPADFGEYGAAKRAGEAIAEMLKTALPDTKVIVERLPPIDTDQNAAVTAPKTISPVEAMLSAVRSVQAGL